LLGAKRNNAGYGMPLTIKQESFWLMCYRSLH
jgi:hypothetical protein